MRVKELIFPLFLTSHKNTREGARIVTDTRPDKAANECAHVKPNRRLFCNTCGSSLQN